MQKFDIGVGDASFNISLGSSYQDHFNTPINLPHFHIDKEVHVVLSGSAIIEVNGKITPTGEGDVYVVPENSTHHYKEHSDGFCKISFLFSISKRRSARGGFSEHAHYSKIFGTVNECLPMRDGELARLGGDLFALDYSEKTRHIREVLYALFFIRFAELIGKEYPSFSSEYSVNRQTHKDSDGRKKLVEEFFLQRYSESVTVEDLARELGKSAVQTHRIVKHYFGESFKSVLTKQRMERACILVKEGERTLTEIAFICGYSSYNGFFSAFKGYTGKTPEQYRSIFQDTP